jgi:hypothetical protein
MSGSMEFFGGLLEDELSRIQSGLFPCLDEKVIEIIDKFIGISETEKCDKLF